MGCCSLTRADNLARDDGCRRRDALTFVDPTTDPIAGEIRIMLLFVLLLLLLRVLCKGDWPGRQEEAGCALR